MTCTIKALRKAIFTSVCLVLAFFIPFVTGAESVRVENPLAFETIQQLLSAILGVVIVLAIPVVVFFIIYAGFLYVTAQGNAQQVQQATQALTYAIIGGVLILGSFALAEIIKGVVTEFSA